MVAPRQLFSNSWHLDWDANCHLEGARQEESETCLGQAPCVVPAALRMLPCAPDDEGRTALWVPALCTVGGCWSVGFFVPGMCQCSSCKRKKIWFKLATWAGRISVPRKQGKISHRAPSRSEEQLLRLVLFVSVPSKCDAVLISVSWNFGTLGCQTL
jgi:hypothetical protein